ncbi:MAG: FeoB-associated Cys-rich membrane protein [Coriobacteriales bacterium]|nr:FeoB-associated Cys-rich membrane protein [Coriobacteriales bacterium]
MLATIIISLILAGIVALAIRSVYRSHKQGGCSSCSSGCSGCNAASAGASCCEPSAPPSGSPPKK